MVVIDDKDSSVVIMKKSDCETELDIMIDDGSMKGTLCRNYWPHVKRTIAISGLSI